MCFVFSVTKSGVFRFVTKIFDLCRTRNWYEGVKFRRLRLELTVAMVERTESSAIKLDLVLKTVPFKIFPIQYYSEGVLTLEPFVIPIHSSHLLTYLFPSIHLIYLPIYLLTPSILFNYLFIPVFSLYIGRKFWSRNENLKKDGFFHVFRSKLGLKLPKNDANLAFKI